VTGKWSSPEGLIGDPLYPRLKQHVVGSTGLTYYEDKDVDFAQRVNRRLSNLRIDDCTSYLNILRDSVRGPSELDELVAEITIGETYFYRHREHFDALRDIVLPDVIARNRASRAIRIWCAGCADGAEPYTLALLLKREMDYQLQGWEVDVLGTDINRHALARARQGIFEEWALRSTSEDVKRACFSRQGKRWQLAPEYKARVSFQYHNLVQDSFPSLLNNLSSFDLILCRNVMIYFGPDLMQRLVRQFQESLVPGGWLLVGPTEPNMTYFTSFHTVNAPGVTLYQKPKRAFPLPVPLASMTIPAIPAPSAALPASSPTSTPAAEPAGLTLADARRYADRGAWESANRCCEELLKKDNLTSVVHFYHALVLEQLRRHAEAERSLRRAIYLDRQAVLPHYYLGLFLQSKGDLRLAARSFENATDLLAQRGDTERFPDADGITTAELRRLAAMHLEILRERV